MLFERFDQRLHAQRGLALRVVEEEHRFALGVHGPEERYQHQERVFLKAAVTKFAKGFRFLQLVPVLGGGQLVIVEVADGRMPL